jgi:hypothetical protein
MTRADLEALMTDDWCARLLHEASIAGGNAYLDASDSGEPTDFASEVAEAAAIETVRSFILQTLPDGGDGEREGL